MSKITIYGYEYHDVLWELKKAVNKEGLYKIANACGVSVQYLDDVVHDRKNSIPQPIAHYLGFRPRTVYELTNRRRLDEKIINEESFGKKEQENAS